MNMWKMRNECVCVCVVFNEKRCNWKACTIIKFSLYLSFSAYASYLSITVAFIFVRSMKSDRRQSNLNILLTLIRIKRWYFTHLFAHSSSWRELMLMSVSCCCCCEAFVAVIVVFFYRRTTLTPTRRVKSEERRSKIKFTSHLLLMEFYHVFAFELHACCNYYRNNTKKK